MFCIYLHNISGEL